MVLLLWYWCAALVVLGAAEMDRVIEAGSPNTESFTQRPRPSDGIPSRTHGTPGRTLS